MMSRPIRHRRALTYQEEIEITQRVAQGEKQAALAREYGVHRNTVSNILARLLPLKQEDPGDQTGASSFEPASATPQTVEIVPAGSPTGQPDQETEQ